jgi:hypothetical protein
MSDADIHVDEENNLLKVFLHRTNHWADDNILDGLCNKLNQTQTVFPTSNLTISFSLVSS